MVIPLALHERGRSTGVLANFSREFANLKREFANFERELANFKPIVPGFDQLYQETAGINLQEKRCSAVDEPSCSCCGSCNNSLLRRFLCPLCASMAYQSKGQDGPSYSWSQGHMNHEVHIVNRNTLTRPLKNDVHCHFGVSDRRDAQGRLRGLWRRVFSEVSPSNPSAGALQKPPEAPTKLGRLIFYHYWCWRAGSAAPVLVSPRNYYQYLC